MDECHGSWGWGQEQGAYGDPNPEAPAVADILATGRGCPRTNGGKGSFLMSLGTVCRLFCSEEVTLTRLLVVKNGAMVVVAFTVIHKR